MKTQTFVLCAVLVITTALCVPSQAATKVIRGIGGAELGMDRDSVLKALDVSKSDLIDIRGKKGFSTMIHQDKLFRHADFIFDDSGILREIVLIMREVVKESRILDKLNAEYSMNLTPENAVVRDGVSVSVLGNTVVIRDGEKMVVSVPAREKEAQKNH